MLVSTDGDADTSGEAFLIKFDEVGRVGLAKEGLEFLRGELLVH